MKKKDLNQAKLEQKNKETVIIDVREAKEFSEAQVPNSLNLASTKFTVEAYLPFKEKNIVLYCQSGRRAKEIYSKLESAGFENVYVSNQHMEHIPKEELLLHNSTWTVDRQFRLVLGLLLLIFLLGYHLLSNYFIIIPIILCSGLTITALIDRCYMRMAIAKLPWNRGKSA